MNSSKTASIGFFSKDYEQHHLIFSMDEVNGKKESNKWLLFARARLKRSSHIYRTNTT